MEDMKNYDDAVIRFHKTLKLSSIPPLASWDFYAQFFDNTCKLSEDVKSLSTIAKNNSWSFDNDIFEEQLKDKEHVIVVTDANLNIVYATQNIWQMNRYRPEQIIGQKPKMFQGEKTSAASLKVISNAIKAKKPFETTVVNYRKDGSTYNCWIQGQPVFNKKGEVVNFIAFEREVA